MLVNNEWYQYTNTKPVFSYLQHANYTYENTYVYHARSYKLLIIKFVYSLL